MASQDTGAPMQKAGTFSTIDAEGGMTPSKAATTPNTFWTHLNEEVDPSQSTGPLAAFCFMTGYMCVLRYLAVKTPYLICLAAT